MTSSRRHACWLRREKKYQLNVEHSDRQTTLIETLPACIGCPSKPYCRIASEKEETEPGENGLANFLPGVQKGVFAMPDFSYQPQHLMCCAYVLLMHPNLSSGTSRPDRGYSAPTDSANFEAQKYINPSVSTGAYGGRVAVSLSRPPCHHCGCPVDGHREAAKPT